MNFYKPKYTGFIYKESGQVLICSTSDNIIFRVINGNWYFNYVKYEYRDHPLNKEILPKGLVKVLDNMKRISSKTMEESVEKAYKIGWRAK